MMALKSERGGIFRSKIALSHTLVRQRRRQDRDSGRRHDRLAAIQCLLDRTRVDADGIEPLPQCHGIAISVGLNRVRAAPLTQLQPHRLEHVLEDIPL